MSTTARRRGFGELFSSIAQNATDLASHEIRLAREEIQHQGKETIRGGIMTLLAGVLAIPTLIFLGLALSVALAEAMPVAIAHLITALVFTLLAAGMYAYGKSKIGGDRETLSRTRSNLERDREAVRENLTNDQY
ncbi:MAG: phage holin family protein [Parvularcula sp.]|jgi:uncharacterized membrane protein YqjE|nr:phage holin family protein [Parvularcula sp.]